MERLITLAEAETLLTKTLTEQFKISELKASSETEKLSTAEKKIKIHRSI